MTKAALIEAVGQAIEKTVPDDFTMHPPVTVQLRLREIGGRLHVDYLRLGGLKEAVLEESLDVLQRPDSPYARLLAAHAAAAEIGQAMAKIFPTGLTPDEPVAVPAKEGLT